MKGQLGGIGLKGLVAPRRWFPRVSAIAAASRRAGCLALAVLALLPVVAFFVAAPPLALRLLVGALLLVALVRPEVGWLALIGLSPFGNLLARLAGSPWSVTEPLVLVFLAGWLGREAVRRRNVGEESAAPHLVLDLAGLFALAITASLAVQLIVLQVSTAFPVDFARFAWRLLWHDYYLVPDALPAVPGAAFMLEGIGLFLASVVLARRAPRVRDAGAGFFAAAAAGVAGLNVASVVQQFSVARPAWSLSGLLSMRVSWVFPDVNAAGSYFVMALFVAGGLAASGRRRVAWLSAALLAIVGLLLSGSRTALLAAPAALVCVRLALPLRRMPSSVTRVMVPAFVALAVVVAAFLAINPRSAASHTETALRWRAEMSSTALRMAQDRPVFGVGPGQFYDLSYDYSTPEWRTNTPHENAHNNFLQVLAELGSVGFLALVGLLAGAFARWCRAVRAGRDAWVLGVGGGALAFVATWIAGHPLLTREVSLAFWVVLGLAAVAARLPASPGESRRRGRTERWAVAAVAVLVVALVPVRAYVRLAHADLTRDGRGFSQWHQGSDGTRFRWMFRRAVLYVPADARQVAIGVRSPGAMTTVRMEMEGRQVGQAVVGGNEWHDFDIQVPRDYPWASVPVTVLVRSYQPAVDAEADIQRRVQVALHRVVR